MACGPRLCYSRATPEALNHRFSIGLVQLVRLAYGPKQPDFAPFDSLARKWKMEPWKTIFLCEQGLFHFHVSDCSAIQQNLANPFKRIRFTGHAPLRDRMSLGIHKSPERFPNIPQTQYNLPNPLSIRPVIRTLMRPPTAQIHIPPGALAASGTALELHRVYRIVGRVQTQDMGGR